jgi:hypothetical protein
MKPQPKEDMIIICCLARAVHTSKVSDKCVWSSVGIMIRREN